jgi:predicted nucleic acid-binding protein
MNVMDNEIKQIYAGSVVNAEFIGSVLEENDIQFLIRNFQEESLVAGWAANVIKGEASVYVFAKDYDRAMLLLDEIQKSHIEEE